MAWDKGGLGAGFLVVRDHDEDCGWQAACVGAFCLVDRSGENGKLDPSSGVWKLPLVYLHTIHEGIGRLGEILARFLWSTAIGESGRMEAPRLS